MLPHTTAVVQRTFAQITVDNLGQDYPMLAGNLTSFLSSGIILVVTSLIKPQNYDFQSMHDIQTVDETGNQAHVVDGVCVCVCVCVFVFVLVCVHVCVCAWQYISRFTEEEKVAMNKALKVMHVVALTLTATLLIAWPLLALPAGVFSEGYFYFWVILSMAWGFAAAIIGEMIVPETIGRKRTNLSPQQRFCRWQRHAARSPPFSRACLVVSRPRPWLQTCPCSRHTNWERARPPWKTFL